MLRARTLTHTYQQKHKYTGPELGAVVQDPTLTNQTHKTALLLSCRPDYINLLREGEPPCEITGEKMHPLEVKRL